MTRLRLALAVPVILVALGAPGASGQTPEGRPQRDRPPRPGRTEEDREKMKEVRHNALKTVYETAPAPGVKVTCVCTSRAEKTTRMATLDCPSDKKNSCECASPLPVISCGGK